jgi:hypothetical protein
MMQLMYVDKRKVLSGFSTGVRIIRRAVKRDEMIDVR